MNCINFLKEGLYFKQKVSLLASNSSLVVFRLILFILIAVRFTILFFLTINHLCFRETVPLKILKRAEHFTQKIIFLI